MSTLPLLALLTDRLVPGVWRVEEPPPGLDDLATGLGWAVATVSADTDKAGLIGDVSAALGAPDYVRANWDSLADGLTDLTPPPGRRLLVVVDAPHETRDGLVLSDILADTIAFWWPEGVVMQVLWIGPGAAPLLDDVDPIRADRLGRTARTGRTPDR